MYFWMALISVYGVTMNLVLAACELWLVRRLRPRLRWLETAIVCWTAAMCLLFVLEIFDLPGLKPILREWFYVPMGVQMVWNVLFLQVLCPIMILVVLAVRWSTRRQSKTAPVAEPDGMSRRRFIYLVGVGAVPATSIVMGVHGGLTRYDLQVRQFAISIAHLPPELEGFTIAHVSDLHSGLFVGPRRLRLITDMTNDLNADLIALTGDIINRELGEFPAALTAMQRMRSRFGLYVCEGNHDAIPGPGTTMQECVNQGYPVLFDSYAVLPVRGQRLVLGGLSWANNVGLETRPRIVSDLFPPRRKNDVRILFAHHPHVFDVAQQADLVLSGHTHGGQIMFGDNVGLGRIRFKYCSGRFQRGKTTMIVSNGAGDWFPCRIGAPAEIGLLTLTRTQSA